MIAPTWQRDGVTLYLGDCLDILPTLEAGSVALSFWSPPYHVGKSYERDVSYDEWAAMLATLLKLHPAILKPGGFCAVNIGDILCYADSNMPRIQAAKPRLPLTSKDVELARREHPNVNRYELARILGVSEQTVQRRIENNNVRGGKSAIQTHMKSTAELIERPAHDAGLYLYDRRIWHKDPCWTNSQWHTNSYRAVDEAEYIWILWNPGITAIKRERLAPREWAKWGSRGVWQIPNVRANDIHEAMFPIELPTRLVRLLTDTGQIVLDPFMGSGTTGLACMNTGRRFIGIEIEPRYFEIAVKRIEQAMLQMRMPI